MEDTPRPARGRGRGRARPEVVDQIVQRPPVFGRGRARNRATSLTTQLGEAPSPPMPGSPEGGNARYFIVYLKIVDANTFRDICELDIRSDRGRLEQFLRDHGAAGVLSTPNTPPMSPGRSIPAKGSEAEDSIRDDQPPNIPASGIPDASNADEGMDHSLLDEENAIEAELDTSLLPSIGVCQSVFAAWSDGMYYSGLTVGLNDLRGWLVSFEDGNTGYADRRIVPISIIGIGMNVQVWVDETWKNGNVQRHKISREKLSTGVGTFMYLVRYGKNEIWSHRADIRFQAKEIREYAKR
ncbi:unnamed protein product, partial [Orchesella dallaii]